MSTLKEAATTPHDLLNELRALVAEAETLVASSLSEHSAEAIGNLRQRLAAIRKQLTEFYGDAREKVVAGARCTDATIRAHPYRSLAVAAGVGLLVGVLLGRRSK